MFTRLALAQMPQLFRCGLLIAVASWVGLIGLREQPSVAARSVFATITVNTIADTVAADGFCSLREAIQAANTNAAVNECPAGAPGLDTIQFNLGVGTPVISLSSPLPAITQALTIDGATGGATRVALDGVTNNGFGLDLQGITGGTIGSLVIRRFQFGIRVQNSSGNTIQSCFIGTNNAGDSSAGAGNSASGIVIINSPNNTIGGTTVGAGNVISANGNFGIDIQSGSNGNLIQGNMIGTDVGGTIDLGNSFSGVQISGASNNTVGGTTANARNVISGNNSNGVAISNATNTLVHGNYIGTNAAGTAALANNQFGVSVSVGAGNFVGGTTAGAGNLISGNGSDGVFLSGSNGVMVQGNIIGLNATGTAKVANASDGVQIDEGFNHTIGGTTASARNVISGNTGAGVFIRNSQTGGGNGANNNLIQGNFIGTDAGGTADLGNSGDGVSMNGIGSGANNNTVGGTAAGAGNVIAFNTGTGVRINVSAVNNRVLGNSIFSNNQLGIDLGSFGVSGNDPGDGDGGANNLQNFPVLTSAVVGGSSTSVRGTLNSTASATFRIEFFSNASCDASGNGEGQTYLGFVSATTDAGGNATFTATLPGAVPLNNSVTATATDANGNTSEFSVCRCVYSFAVSPAAFSQASGSGTITVSNGASCAWTAVSNAAWLTVTGGTPGAGNGLVTFNVAANATTAPRVGSITIAGEPLFISQAATGLLVTTDFSEGIPPGWTVVHNGTGNYPNGKPATWTTDNPCNRLIPAPFAPPFAIIDSACAIQPATQDESLISPPFDATGLGQVILQFDNQFRWFSGGDNEIGDVDVSTDGGQNWDNALRMQGANDGFPMPNIKTVNLTDFISGNPANVRVRFRYYVTAATPPVSPTPTSAPRDALKPSAPNAPAFQELSWGIDRPTILAFTISPTTQSFNINGGSGQIAVEAAAGVEWMAQSNVPWVMLTGNGGTGSGSIGYQVAANSTGALRPGTLTVAHNSFTVMQDGTCPTIDLAPATLPGGTAGTPYSQLLTASGGALPYVFTLVIGELPGGIAISANGQLSGTPTTFGTFNFTIKVTDANNCVGEQSYTQVISPACGTITLNPSTLPNGFVGTEYNQTLTASGGTPPYTFTVSAGAPPGGVTLSTGGVLAGTPATQSTFPFTVRARDANGCFSERSFMLHISGNGLMFYPLPSPVRLLDTRSGFSGCTIGIGALAAGSTRTQPARTACSTIPANATAIIGNITVVPSRPGYLTLFPGNSIQPTVANSNFTAGEVTNNFFTVGLNTEDGAFKIFTSATTDVIIDLTGYYAPPSPNGLFYHPLPSPVRLVETRAGQTGCFQPAQLQGTNNPNDDPALDLQVQGRSPGLSSACNAIPNDAVVLVGNATTVLPNAPLGFGYLTIYPSDAARPTVASSNYATNDVINGPFAVKLGADGKFKIYTFSTTDLVVDISGYYSASASDANGEGLLFNPLSQPMRLLETRLDFPGFPLTGCYRTKSPIQGLPNIRTQQAWGACLDQPPLTIPETARALVGNATVLNPMNAGFLTFFPGNVTTAPTVATSNYPFPVVFGYNRHYYVGLSPMDGTFRMLAQFTTDLIVDVSGYFAP